MIEKKIVREKFLEYEINEFFFREFPDVLIERVSLEKTPLGERIVIKTPVPGLIIGSRGSNINSITNRVKDLFKLENPQIKILDSRNPFSARVIARRIVNSFKRYGTTRFKLVGYKTVDSVMKAGAEGIEVVLSGKLPSSRAKSWRFIGGYVRKTGYVSDYYIEKAKDSVSLKTGVVGIKVSVMTKDLPLPQKVDIIKREEAVHTSNEMSDKEVKTDIEE